MRNFESDHFRITKRAANVRSKVPQPQFLKISDITSSAAYESL